MRLILCNSNVIILLRTLYITKYKKRERNYRIVDRKLDIIITHVLLLSAAESFLMIHISIFYKFMYVIYIYL